jgi:hypothetical protein
MAQQQTKFSRFMNDGTRVTYTVFFSLDMEGIVIVGVERDGQDIEYRPDVWMDAMDAVEIHLAEIHEDEAEFGLANEEW